MSEKKPDLSGIEEVARQYAEARNLVIEWGRERGLDTVNALGWVAGYANDNGLLKG